MHPLRLAICLLLFAAFVAWHAYDRYGLPRRRRYTETPEASPQDAIPPNAPRD